MCYCAARVARDVQRLVIRRPCAPSIATVACRIAASRETCFHHLSRLQIQLSSCRILPDAGSPSPFVINSSNAASTSPQPVLPQQLVAALRRKLRAKGRLSVLMAVPRQRRAVVAASSGAPRPSPMPSSRSSRFADSAHVLLLHGKTIQRFCWLSAASRRAQHAVAIGRPRRWLLDQEAERASQVPAA